MVSTSIDFPQDLLDDMDDAVEDSYVFESRSQLVKASVRKMLEEGADDFDQAR